MRISVVNWEIRPITETGQFFAHLVEVVLAAAPADLIVLPELFILELCALRPDLQGPPMVPWLADHEPRFTNCLKHLAAEVGATLVGGSVFAHRGGRIVHVCQVVTPSGKVTEQPKNVLTQFELVDWGLAPATGLARQQDPHLGVLVCYDSEFPLGARTLAESGVLVLAVPAYTETEHGFHRVRRSCEARAIENQIIVVHASLVGALGREPIPTTHGSSAILAPCVPPFPANGVIAETRFNQEDIARAEIDLAALLQSREEGDVRNWHDRNASAFPWLSAGQTSADLSSSDR